ncbi:esterase/lipase family protein [Paucidesulfovibrio longus]|uniref:esterase/lipase family protein n=1 Tax=Paucidesulfovibrio longus TaxID=889 RepID=UPI0003B486FC|nr:alpha/beta fold hydrolase [Paucidesulfovibrio longus]
MKHLYAMSVIAGLFILFVLFLPAALYAASIAVNAANGNLERIRAASGSVAWGALRGWLNSVRSTLIIGATFPFHRLLVRRGSGRGTPVVLVHGLYHNAAAWLFFGRWLARRGYSNLYTVSYGSFTRVFPEIVQEVGRVLERALEDNPGKKALLCGHSLGGLVVRALLAEERFAGRIAGAATLGTPHRGSVLARIALGRLGRSLHPRHPLFQRLAALPEPQRIPRLALFAPLDNMVMPEQCLRPRRPGWKLERLPLSVSHVGLIYSRALAARVAEFFREAEAEAGGDLLP